MRARDVMTRKVRTISPDADVKAVAKLLASGRISAVPVVDGKRHVLGIVSESDLIRRPETGTTKRRSWWLQLLADPRDLARDYAKSRAVRARDVMSSPVISISPATDLADVADLLESRGIKRVPVVQNGKLVGIVSRRDIVRALARNAKPGHGRKRSDAQISEAIHHEIKATRFISDVFVNVSVSKGVVELSGLVSDQAQRDALRVLVEATPGVTAVRNRLAIRSPVYAL
jgi:CBS domain-containing protein